MSKPTFKVGDRVRIIKGIENHLWPNVLMRNRLGAVGVIVEIDIAGWARINRDDGSEFDKAERGINRFRCAVWFPNLELVDVGNYNDAYLIQHPSGGNWDGKYFTSKDGFTYTKEHLDKLITELMEIRVWIEDNKSA